MYFNWAHGLPLNAVLDPSHPCLRVQDVRDFLKAFGLVSFPRISGAMVSDSLSVLHRSIIKGTAFALHIGDGLFSPYTAVITCN